MKTLVVLLSFLGSAPLMAQSSNYSSNVVACIMVTCQPGFNMISCPLVASPDNTIGTLLNNNNQAYTGDNVYFFEPATHQYFVEDSALPIGGKQGTSNVNGWALNGTNVLNPGIACWFQNTHPTNVTLTFFGTIPQGSLTNILQTGFNLVSSIVPASGDIISNSIMHLTNYHVGDAVFTFFGDYYFQFESSTAKGDPLTLGGYNANWGGPGFDPFVTNVAEGYWYQNTGITPVIWVENFLVNPP